MKDKEAFEVATKSLNKISNLQNQELFKLSSLKKQYDYETKVHLIDNEILSYENSLLSKLLQKTKKKNKVNQQGKTHFGAKESIRLDYIKHQGLQENKPLKLEYHNDFDFKPQQALSLPSSTKNKKSLIEKRASLSQDKNLKVLQLDNASTGIGSLSISNANAGEMSSNLFSFNQAAEFSNSNLVCNQNDYNQFQAGIKNINVSIVNNSNLILQDEPKCLGNGQLIKPIATQSNNVGPRNSNSNNKRITFSKPTQINNLPDTKSMSSGKFQNKSIMLETINTKSKKSPTDISSPKNLVENGKKDSILGKVVNSNLLLRTNQNTINQPASGLISVNKNQYNNRFDEPIIKQNPSNINLNFSSKGANDSSTKPVLTVPSKQKDSSKDIISMISNGKARQLLDISKGIGQMQPSIKDPALKAIKKPIAASQAPNAKPGK